MSPYMPTEFEIDQSLRSVYLKIEKKKQKELSGVKNWCCRRVTSVKEGCCHDKVRTVSYLVAFVFLNIGVAYLAMGTWGIYKTSDYETPANMATWGHAPEWIGEALLYLVCTWKLQKNYQLGVEHRIVDDIYRKYIKSSKLSAIQINHLNRLREEELYAIGHVDRPDLSIKIDLLKDLEKGKKAEKSTPVDISQLSA